MIIQTGTRVSPDDIAEARKRSAEVQATPVIIVAGRWLHEDAASAFSSWIDDLAAKYGLPAPGTIDGEINHYGLSPEGEFTRYEP